jgi:two-component system response regulator PrrA
MKTVLVVDESDVVLEHVKRALEGAGYAVITRNKPSGSVSVILRDKPDVVLLDVNMPMLAGDTIAKILARQNSETLVLLHSTLSIDDLRLKAIASGAHGYIQKTDSAVELVRRIEYWLRRIRNPASSSRLEAASAAGATGAPHPGAAPASSGRFAAAPSVGSGAAVSGGAPSSGKFKAAPVAPSTSSSAGSSSGRWRAAAAHVSGLPGSSDPTAEPRAAASEDSPKSAPTMSYPLPPPAGTTPTSRNMRAAKPIVSGGGRVGKVLFVDDDWKILSAYRLVVAGYLDAEFVSSSDDALSRILSDTPPQVVVCDIVMPGLSGADIYRRAVLLDPRWASRFIFITGAASTPSVAEFLNTLDVRVFHKPVATDRLLDTLKHMTEAQRR